MARIPHGDPDRAERGRRYDAMRDAADPILGALTLQRILSGLTEEKRQENIDVFQLRVRPALQSQETRRNAWDKKKQEAGL